MGGTPFARCLCGALTIWPEEEAWALRGGRGDHADGSACPYVACDDPTCRALAQPHSENVEQLRAAYEHWRLHQYLHGCSHGR